VELSFDQIRKYWEVRHPGQRIQAREKVTVCCVLHGEDNPSCTLYLDGNGGFNCHACGAKGNLFQFEARFSKCTLQQAEINVSEVTGAKASVPMGKLGPPVAFYDYRDENGTVLYQKRRYEPELSSKTFLTYRATPKGFVSKIDPPDGPPTRRVLFNLPDMVKANMIFLTEGEKDAVNLGSAGLFANAGYNIACTCSYGGAWQAKESPKWLDSYDPYFTGKFVIIFADNDAPGRVYAEHVAAAIQKYAYRVRIVYFPELPEKGDASDYLEAHTVAELEAKVKAAPVWEGQPSERKNWLVEAVDWASTENPEIDWLIDGVIQRDANGIFAAEPKTGKSLCALDMLLSLVTGQPWLSRDVPKRVRSAYISREDSPILTKVRIKGFLGGKGFAFHGGEIVDPTGWLWCNTREQLGDFDIDNDEHLKNMAHDLKERGIEFTVIDVLNRIHNRSENDNTEMVQVVGRISQMGREAGCSVGLVHHVSKENNTGRFFTRIRGASAIHGWTEWSIGLSLGEKDKDGKLIRTAEFETKAGESCAPISFTVEFQAGNLFLKLAEPAPKAQTTGTNGSVRESWQQRYN
jgi:hypothetical protein